MEVYYRLKLKEIITLIYIYVCVCIYIYIFLQTYGEGNGTPLQYSCLENPMDGGSLVGCSPWGR